MKRFTRREILSIPPTLALIAGCSESKREATNDAAAEPLRVAAATDLRFVLPEIAAAFGDRDGPLAPPVFGASGDLAEQIRAGAPFDVFLSADMEFPKTLEAEGLIEPGSVVPYARGSLVLLVHPDVAATVVGLADLAGPGIRKIAIADPAVAPYGRAARSALEGAGLWEPLRDRIVTAGPVSQAFRHVEDGNADAALVSRSLIAGAKSRVVEIDRTLYPPRIQGLGIPSSTPRKERARRFVAFLLGEEGRRLLADRGFAPPSP